MNQFDHSIFYGINRWPDSQAPFWVFLSKGVSALPVLIVLAGISIWLIWQKKTREGGLIAALGWIFANFLTDLWKAFVHFPRPNNLIPDVIMRVGHSDSMGTASAHSANMMFVAAVFLYYFRWWGIPWLVLAILVGISRVYVGAHFPSQVLLGWTTGIAAAAIVIGLVKLILSRFKPKPEPIPDSQD